MQRAKMVAARDRYTVSELGAQRTCHPRYFHGMCRAATSWKRMASSSRSNGRGGAIPPSAQRRFRGLLERVRARGGPAAVAMSD